MNTYSELARLYGGMWLVAGVCFTMICFMAVSVYYNNAMLKWTNEPYEQQEARFEFYTIVCFTTGTATSIFMFTKFCVFVCGNQNSLRVLHTEMLSKVLNAPINLYFDVTPIGKILNRFSKDLDVLEMQLLFTLNFFTS